MFKPELWQSHDEYRTIVSKFGRRLSRNYPKYSWGDYDEERQKLFFLQFLKIKTLKSIMEDAGIN